MLDSEVSGHELVWQKPTLIYLISNKKQVHDDRGAWQTQGICQDGSGNQQDCGVGVQASDCNVGGDGTV